MKSWIIDERFYSGEDCTIEVFSSKEQRDDRLLYLNNGKIYDEYNNALDQFYDGFEVEIGGHSKYNDKPIGTMKPGDKVWFLESLTKTIVCANIDKIIAGVYCLSWDDYSVALPESEIFPTREALCEHYRKIFE